MQRIERPKGYTFPSFACIIYTSIISKFAHEYLTLRQSSSRTYILQIYRTLQER